jgi:hypothetical protein
MAAPFFAAADWYEVLAALIFFLVTGLAQWIQKRARARRGIPEVLAEDIEGPAPASPHTMPPVIRRESPTGEDTWEEQLRRLLEPETAPPPPLPRAPPLAPPSPVVRTPLVSSREDESARSLEEVSLEDEVRPPLRRPTKAWTAWTPRSRSAGNLQASTAAYQRAFGMPDVVSARVQDALARAGARDLARRDPYATARAGGTSSASLLVHDPATARQAFLGAIIFQPPKALE